MREKIEDLIKQINWIVPNTVVFITEKCVNIYFEGKKVDFLCVFPVENIQASQLEIEKYQQKTFELAIEKLEACLERLKNANSIDN